MPYEFTEEGMLQRMNAYLEGQNFCSFQKTAKKWPPGNSVKVFLGESDKSCNDVCWEKGECEINGNKTCFEIIFYFMDKNILSRFIRCNIVVIFH